METTERRAPFSFLCSHLQQSPFHLHQIIPPFITPASGCAASNADEIVHRVSKDLPAALTHAPTYGWIIK